MPGICFLCAIFQIYAIKHKTANEKLNKKTEGGLHNGKAKNGVGVSAAHKVFIIEISGNADYQNAKSQLGAVKHSFQRNFGNVVKRINYFINHTDPPFNIKVNIKLFINQ